MKFEQDKEIKVEVIDIDHNSEEIILRIMEGENKGTRFSIELFLSKDGSHDIEVGDIAYVKLRMAN